MDEKPTPQTPDEAQAAQSAQPTQPETAQPTQPEPTQPMTAPAAQTEPTQPAVTPEPTSPADGAAAPTAALAPEQPAPPAGEPQDQAAPAANAQPSQPYPGQTVAAQQPASQPSPTGALVCGILAIVFCFIPIVGIVLGIVAIVLAGKYFKAGGTLGQGKAGRICGIVGIVLSVVMIVVNAIAIFTALNVLDELDNYDTSSRYVSTDQSQSSSASSSYIADDETEQAVQAAMNAQLDLIKDQDPATIAKIEAMAEETFQETFEAYIPDSAGIEFSMRSCGIDPAKYVALMTEGFSYEASYVDAVSETSASADYDVTMRNIIDVISNLSTAMYEDDVFTSSETSTEEKLTRFGEMFMKAVEDAEIEDGNYWYIDFENKNGTWVVDEDSWNDELEYSFGFDY